MNTASGINAHIEGQENISGGRNAHFEGYGNKGKGKNEHLEGANNKTWKPEETIKYTQIVEVGTYGVHGDNILFSCDGNLLPEGIYYTLIDSRIYIKITGTQEHYGTIYNIFNGFIRG